MTTRAKGGTVPRSRSKTRRRSATCKSVRVIQQTQPLPRRTISSVASRSSASSIPTAPNSLTITAVPCPSGEARKRRSSVVLPAPRKPVTTVTGIRAPRSRFNCRPNGPASREGKRSSKSEIHLEDVEPADMAIDGVDDAALVDEDVVHLDGAGGRAGRRRRREHADLLRLIGVRDVVGAQAAVEKGAEHDLIRL